MDSTKAMNISHKTSSRNYLQDDDVKKDNIHMTRRASTTTPNHNRNYQKSKKMYEEGNDVIHEQKEIVRLPSIININAIKPPQYIAYTSKNIDGEVILKDTTGELWLQPSNSLLSKKSENRLRSKLEFTKKQNKLKDEGKKQINDNSYELKMSAFSVNDSDTNFKRNFDKYFSDVQKLIDYAKNPIFNDGSTQNISIDMEKDKRKRKAQNNSYDPGSADSQKMSINGRKPIRIINLELEMKLDNLRNNDIERENFERKIESLLQSKKIQKINFNILMNNKKIKKIEEVKKLKNEYIERYNQHILEVLKQEKKLLYHRLNKIKKDIDYKNMCSEMEKEREVNLKEFLF
ncbi:hypothetical protein PIROE2DRAFT_63878 [Piromyces sp. E2]|nr:hypothetical protein PIROE2DRAFT_63878 [Piromyces sp. E2]|eukprot:OUM59280.1 hypothetical protein PIROE2DRAFT_63878 [Piromyces sp. E2]